MTVTSGSMWLPRDKNNFCSHPDTLTKRKKINFNEVEFIKNRKRKWKDAEGLHVQRLQGLRSFIFGAVAHHSVSLGQVEVECDQGAVLHAQGPQSRTINLEQNTDVTIIWKSLFIFKQFYFTWLILTSLSSNWIQSMNLKVFKTKSQNNFCKCRSLERTCGVRFLSTSQLLVLLVLSVLQVVPSAT